MNCAECGKEAREGDRFCSGCGVSLSPSARRDVVDDLIRDYRKELEDKPDDTSVLYNLGLALERKGRLDEALDVWRTVQMIEREFPDVDEAIVRLRRRIEDRGAT